MKERALSFCTRQTCVTRNLNTDKQRRSMWYQEAPNWAKVNLIVLLYTNTTPRVVQCEIWSKIFFCFAPHVFKFISPCVNKNRCWADDYNYSPRQASTLFLYKFISINRQLFRLHCCHYVLPEYLHFLNVCLLILIITFLLLVLIFDLFTWLLHSQRDHFKHYGWSNN